MTSASIKITDTASPAIQGLLDAFSDISPMMEALSAAFEANVQLAFIASTDPYDNPWAALSDVTIARRRQQSSVIGRDTNRLMNSMLRMSGNDFAGVETNVEYARSFHYGARQGQYGRTSRNSPIPWGDVPGRQILPTGELPESWDRDINETMMAYMEHAWNN